MANAFIKAEKVVRQMLGVLEREVVLPALLWRDAGGSFKGAKDDTISIRIPAYTTARTRVMRSGTPITVDELDETKVDITLDTHVYKAIGVTDEEMTLDIVDFGEQVTAPSMGAVVRQIEDSAVTEMINAGYETELVIDEDDPYLALVDARIALNNANVPVSGRALAVGSGVEAAILKSDRLSKFDQSGSTDALREASMGRIAGFQVVSVPGIDPDFAVAFHRTAFPIALQAPEVPQGAAWGESRSFAGFALRVLKDYDFTNVRDRLLTDVFLGTGTTRDRGTIDENGKFQPSVDGEDDPILVRAVLLTLEGVS